MTRLDLLPDEQLEQAVVKLESDFRELKSHQEAGAGTIIYRQNSNASWDLTGSGPLVDAYVRVTFTADTQPYAFADCFASAEFDYGGSTYQWTPDINVVLTGSSLVLFSISRQPILDPRLAADQSSIAFIFRMNVDASVNYRVLFYVVSNDTGSIEVEFL